MVLTADRKLAAAILLAMCMSVSAQAQTLEEALAMAYEYNPDLRAARESLKATDEQLAQALAYWWRPTFDVILTDQYQHIDQSTDQQFVNGGVAVQDFSEETHTQSIELESELYLYNGGQTQAAIENARATIQAQEAVLAATEMTTLQSVSSSYADVVLQIVSLELSNQYLGELADLHLMVTDMLASQRATVGDLAQVDLSIAEGEDTRLSTETDLQTARNQFRSLTGILPNALQRWPALPAVPETLREALDIAMSSNPNLAAAQAEVTANEAAVREDEGTLLPIISVTADYTVEFDKERFSHSQNGLEHDRENTATIMLQLTFPLYDGGTSYSLVREAKRVVSQSRANLQKAVATVENDVTTAWQTLDLSERRIDAGMERWLAASEALAAQFRLFSQGEATIQDLIDAHEDLSSAELAVEQAQHDSFNAHVDLLVAMGLYDARYLNLPVTFYDPRAYLREITDLPFGIGLD
ncbi:MAG: TolC family protein [Proteobacteria bacterium]|nr:TolC family protein [Pseudomonadota bacterium]